MIEPRREVSYGDRPAPGLPWASDAEEHMRRIPSFVRGVVVSRVEQFARERGHTQVTVELLQEVRRAMPVDFSKRRPFFLRDDA